MLKFFKCGLLMSVLVSLIGCSTTQSSSAKKNKKKETSYERFYGGRFER
jgi:hypothetical protein